jgi:spore germination protein KA
MFKEIFKKIGNKDKKNSKAKTETKTETPVELQVHKSIETNLLQLKEIMGNCPDILIRRYKAGANEAVNCAVILLDGMTNQLLVTEGIFKPLHNEAKLTSDNAFPKIKDAAMTIAEVKETQDFSNLVDSLLSGDAILLIDGNAAALIVGTTQVPSRSISEPIIEPTIRGPRDGFTEVLKMNIALIRRRIKSPRLQTESFNLGNLSKTKVMIAYIKGKADAEIVAEVRRRLKQIEMDLVLESGYIEELIKDSRYSPFYTINRTERPDKVAAHLNEGKVAIFTDNTPFVLTIPFLFFESLQANEDYYENFYIGTVLRWVRIISIIISLINPSLYVAICTFHPDLIPTPLLLTIAAAREGIPFPAVIEILFLEVTWEILREAGVRFPRPIGNAVTIVGGLIIGDAAVKAGYISPSVVIIVSITAVAAYAIPGYTVNLTFRMLRFPLLILSAFLGLYGLLLGLIIILIHMASLRSFGVPYLTPIAPWKWQDIKDIFFRIPWWAKETVPKQPPK